jgi:hypothetical protein
VVLIIAKSLQKKIFQKKLGILEGTDYKSISGPEWKIVGSRRGET